MALTAMISVADSAARSVASKLAEQTGYEVVGVNDKAADALRLASLAKPRLVVLDLDIPGSQGLSLVAELRDLTDGCEVLLLTQDHAIHDSAMEAGAFGTVTKDHLHELEGALGRAHEFIASGATRHPGERRTGKDRRQKQDWQKVTQERRQGDRRHAAPGPNRRQDDRRKEQDWQKVTQERRQGDRREEPDAAEH